MINKKDQTVTEHGQLFEREEKKNCRPHRANTSVSVVWHMVGHPLWYILKCLNNSRMYCCEMWYRQPWHDCGDPMIFPLAPPTAPSYPVKYFNIYCSRWTHINAHLMMNCYYNGNLLTFHLVPSLFCHHPFVQMIGLYLSTCKTNPISLSCALCLVQKKY